MRKTRKKSNFTLLEALIALTLAALLISTLTYFYGQMSRIDAQIEHDQQENFAKRLLENRLSYTLQRAVKSSNKEFEFFTSAGGPLVMKAPGHSLLFTYNNSIDLDKSLSNEVLGRLFVDNQNRLVLATWPAPSTWNRSGIVPEMKREILMEQVDRVEWSFFVPPAYERGKTSPKQTVQPSPPNDWRTDWLSDFHQLPAIVKVTVYPLPVGGQKKESLPIQLVFPLPQTDQPIYYGN